MANEEFFQEQLARLKSADPVARMGAVESLAILNDERVMEYLVQALVDVYEGVRGCAASSLGKLGDNRAVPPLVRALKDESSFVRKSVVEALGLLGDERVVEPLRQAQQQEYTLFQASDQVVEAIKEALIKIGNRGKPSQTEGAKASRDLPSLIALLNESDPNTRYSAVMALRKTGDVQIIDPLINTLRKGGWKDRVSAQKIVAKAIANIGAPALGPLTTLLKEDKSEYVVAGVAEALGYMKNPDAVDPLLNALRTNYDWVHYYIATALANIGLPAMEPLLVAIKDENYSLRKGAVIALGKIAQPEAVEPLIAELKNGEFRSTAAKALGEIGDVRAMDSLIDALNDEDVRDEAAEALGNIGDIRARDPLLAASGISDFSRNEALAKIKIKAIKEIVPLIAALKDTDKFVCGCAADALGKLKDARAVEPLLVALKESDPYISCSVAEALGEFKDTSTVEPLLQALKDRRLGMRQHAAIALGKIGDVRAIEPLRVALNDEEYSVRDRAADALDELGWEF